MFRKENNDFYNGVKPKKFKSIFWAETSINIVLEYTKKCEKATFGGGGMFFFNKRSLIMKFWKKYSLGIDTLFATMGFPPTYNFGVLVQPSSHGCFTFTFVSGVL